MPGTREKGHLGMHLEKGRSDARETKVKKILAKQAHRRALATLKAVSADADARETRVKEIPAMQVHRRADFAGVRAECAHPGAHQDRMLTNLLSAPSVFEAEEDPFSGGIRKIGGLHRPQHLKLIQVNAGGAKGAW